MDFKRLRNVDPADGGMGDGCDSGLAAPNWAMLRDRSEVSRRATILVGAAFSWLLAALGCGGAIDTPTGGAASGAGGAEDLKFYWIPKELPATNPVFALGLSGAQTKARELTNNGDRTVKLVVDAPVSAANVSYQADLVLNAKAERADGLAVSCNSAEALRSAIDSVVEAGIPVMTFDSDSEHSKRFTYLGGDNHRAGVLAATLLSSVIGGSPDRNRIALVSGVRGADNLERRIAGFLETIQKTRTDLSPLVDEIAYSDDDPQKAAAAVEETMRNHPDVGGFFFVGMWALRSCVGTDCSQSMRQWSRASAEGTVKTVAFDTLQFELDFVKTGLISGLVGQRCWGWGSDSIQILYDHVMHHTVFDSWTDTGLDVVCPNNVEEMQHLWEFERLTPQLSDCIINGVTIK